MAWTAPRTWSTGELVTATMMNTHVRDNLLALKTPPAASVATFSATSTTSTTFVDYLDVTITFNTEGGAVMAFLSTSLQAASNEHAILCFNVDGVDQTPLAREYIDSSAVYRGAFIHQRLVLAAGSHTIKARWRSVGGTSISRATSITTLLTAIEY